MRPLVLAGVLLAGCVTAPAAEDTPAVAMLGARIVDGPARAALPILPLAIDEEGYLVGRASILAITGERPWDVRAWFSYCGARPSDGGDDRLRRAPEAGAGSPGDGIGELLRPEDVPANGSIRATWRGEGRAEHVMPSVRIFRLANASAEEPLASFAVGDVVAFADRSTYWCVAVRTLADDPGAARFFTRVSPGDGILLVETHAPAAWDPARLVPDWRVDRPWGP